MRQSSQTPLCVWFTGLSGAGKSTTAKALAETLTRVGVVIALLDGDNIRKTISADLGFSAADRSENIHRIADAAKLAVDSGQTAIVAAISPFLVDRAAARLRFARDEFIEVFVDAPLTECERRDSKGLYAKARRGEIKNFTGIDSDYEPPVAAEVHLHTANMTTANCVAILLKEIQQAQNRWSCGTTL